MIPSIIYEVINMNNDVEKMNNLCSKVYLVWLMGGKEIEVPDELFTPK